MVRPPSCEELNERRGHWTEEEDAKILAFVSKHGTGSWTAAPKKAGIKRCGKSCRLRWNNCLRPNLRHENFTPQEEEMIIRLHAAIGSRWSIIAQQLPGRTDSDVKNYWNTKLRKKLSEMGIDPVTHKPFSQILADYGNIGGIPNAGTRIGSLNRDFKNTFIFKSEQFPIPQEGFSDFNTHLTTATTGQTQDSFLNRSNNHYTNNSSLDLLAQLQAITLITEVPNITNHETNTPYTEGSSSSSTSPAPTQVNSSLGFSWRDFLLEDPFLPDASSQAENDQILQNEAKQEEKHNFGAGEEMGYNLPINSFEASSSSDSSFVEAMLDRQNNMLLEFPGLLEESFFY